MMSCNPKGLFGLLEWVTGSCGVHGDYRTMARPGAENVECPECVMERTRKTEAELAAVQRIAWLHKCAEVPGRYADAGFRGYRNTIPGQAIALTAFSELFQAMKRGDRRGAGLFVTGSVGTGKTHLCCALANNLAQTGISVRYTTATAMISEIRAAYSNSTVTEAELIDRFIAFQVLIIDEIDAVQPTDNALDLLFRVVNGRYNALLPTVAVANQKGADLEKVISARTVDRLRDNATIVVMDWQSERSAA